MKFIAFIRPQDAPGPVRIVETTHPKRIFEESDQASPVPLHLIAALDAKTWPLEWWRTTLTPWNSRGDWYTPSPQVLCLIEDAILGNIEPPPPHANILDTIPESVRPLTDEEAKRLKWAFPTPDPYPPINVEPTPQDQAKALALKALKAVEARTKDAA